MKRGTCNYKGKFPLVFFDYGEIGIFFSKFLHKNEPFTKENKGQINFKKKGFKKNFLSKEDSSSSEEESDSDEENKERVLFMAKHNKWKYLTKMKMKKKK